MSQPEPQPAPVHEWSPAVEIVCPECGELVSVKDPAALIRALHLANDCSVSGLLAPQA